MAGHYMTPADKRKADSALRYAKDLVGGWPHLAAKLSTQSDITTITFQGCHHWLQPRSAVPPYWARLIEEITNRRVRCEDLRPDIFGTARRA